MICSFFCQKSKTKSFALNIAERIDL